MSILLLVSSGCAQPVASPSDVRAQLSPAVSAAGSPPGSVDCRPPSICDGPLEQGRYVSTSLGRKITLTLDGGWTGTPDLPGEGFLISTVSNGAPAALSVVAFDGEVFKERCNATGTEEIGRDPDSFVSWVGALAPLSAGQPVDATVAGLPARQIDVVAALPSECLEPPWIFLWVLPVSGDFHLNDGEHARFIAVDAGDRTFVVVIEALLGADHEAFFRRAMSVIQGMTIE